MDKEPITAGRIRPLQIGRLTVGFPVILAPMAGYTDAAMRILARRFYCGMTYTEVVSADGLVRGSRQTLSMLDAEPGDAPLAAHLYGADAAVLAAAAVAVEKLGRFQSLDLNCGCPVSKVVAKGAGAALMKSPEKIGGLVRAIRRAVSLPVTIKTRLGLAPDRMNVSEIAQAAEEAGASAIAIHTRCATGRHGGPADWAALARVKTERTIPVIGNGGVRSGADVFRMMAETGVDGVMIGKAAIGNPWIFEEAWRLQQGLPPRAHGLAEHRAVVLEHLRLLIAHKQSALAGRRRAPYGAEMTAVLHFRAHLAGYIRGFPGSVGIRRSLQAMARMEDVQAALDRLDEKPPGSGGLEPAE